MSELAAAFVAAGVGAGLAVGVHRVARAHPRLLHRPYRPFVWTVVGISVLAAAAAPVDPTGIGALDVAYRMAFAAAVTLASGRARRGPRLVAGALAAAGTVGAWPWNVAAFAALGLAVGSSATRRPARPLGVLVGALVAQALLRLSWPDASYATATVAATTSATLVMSGWRHARSSERRVARWAAAGVATAAAIALVALGAAGLGVQRDLVDGARAANRGLDAVRAGDTGRAVDSLGQAERHLGNADDGLHAAWLAPARLLPVAGRYLDAGRQLTSAAVDVVDPALDSARLTAGEALAVRGARVDLDAVAALAPALDRTLAAVPEARRAVASVRDEPLPAAASRELDELDAELARAVDDGQVARTAIELAPELLGRDRPRRWLVLMQTPSEQRASGGLAGAYGEVVADAGRLELVRSGEFNELGPRGPGARPFQLPADVAAEYARFDGAGPQRYPQNLTNVANFPTVARAAIAIYPQAAGPAVDGVISVDPAVLASVLSLTGPVQVAGWPEPLAAGNAERVLLYEQYLRLDGQASRRFVTEAVEATFDALETRDLPNPARIASALAPHIRSGRLKLYSPAPAEQTLFAQMGATGALPDPGGDFFQVVTQNGGESKIDWFQQRAIDYRVAHDPRTGQVDVTATVAITNGAPGSGESELLIGGSNFAEAGPPGRSRLVVDFHSALDLVTATLDGQALDVARAREHGHHRYSTGVTLGPGQTSVYVLHLTGLFDAGQPYRLLLGAQPVVRPDRAEVSVALPEGTIMTAVRGLGRRDGEAVGRFALREPRRIVVAAEIRP